MIKTNQRFWIALILILCTKFVSAQSDKEQLFVDSLFAIADTIQLDSLKIDHLKVVGTSFTLKNPSIGILILTKLKKEPYYNKMYPAGSAVDLYLGILYSHSEEYDKAETILNDYYEYAKSTNYLKGMGAAKFKLGEMYLNLFKEEKCIDACITSAKIYETLKDTARQIQSLSHIGNVLFRLKRYDESLEKFRSLLVSSKNAPHTKAGIYNSIASIYLETNQLDSSFYYSQKYYDITKSTNHPPNIAIAAYNLGLSYQAMDKQDDALRLFNECIDIANGAGISFVANYGYLSKGKILTETNKPKEALNMFDFIEEKELTIDQQKILADGRFKSYKNSGNNKKALGYLEDWRILNDSIQKMNLESQANELQVKYETAEKEKEVAKLSYEKVIHEQKVTSQRWGLIGMGIALLMLGFLLYRLNHQKKHVESQNSIIATTLKEKDILLREIHHRVKNNLQLISSLLTLQGRSINDEVAIAAINDGKSRVRSMALIHQDLYNKENLTDIGVKNYLQKLSRELFDTYSVDKNRISLELQIDDFDIDVDILVPLGLIINELITNSLKYAFPNDRTGQIFLSFKKDGDKVILKVEDDGVGFSPEDIKSESFGSVLISALSDQLEADLIIENDNGTKVKLEINL